MHFNIMMKIWITILKFDNFSFIKCWFPEFNSFFLLYRTFHSNGKLQIQLVKLMVKFYINCSLNAKSGRYYLSVSWGSGSITWRLTIINRVIWTQDMQHLFYNKWQYHINFKLELLSKLLSIKTWKTNYSLPVCWHTSSSLSVPTPCWHFLPLGAGISGSWTTFGWLQDVLFKHV